jgi:hypothetical protein
MKGIDPKWAMYLGILVTLEQAIGHGTVSLTNLVPMGWAPYITSWCNFLAFIGTSIMTYQAAVSAPVSGPAVNTPISPLAKMAIILAVMLWSLFGFDRAHAADNLPALPNFAIKAPAPAPCTPQNCSGWYAGFGVLGDGSNADIIGNGINGSVFSTGGAIKIQGGYQLWSGAWFAAIDGGIGYEFTTNTSASLPVTNKGGSKFIGTELVKLGYNFFPQSATAATTPSQSPIPLVVPANLLASSTPYATFGGMQRRGISEWVNGVGVQTVIAAGWSSDVKYLYAPSQQGIPATSVVMIELNKHF